MLRRSSGRRRISSADDGQVQRPTVNRVASVARNQSGAASGAGLLFAVFLIIQSRVCASCNVLRATRATRLNAVTQVPTQQSGIVGFANEPAP